VFYLEVFSGFAGIFSRTGNDDGDGGKFLDITDRLDRYIPYPGFLLKNAAYPLKIAYFPQLDRESIWSSIYLQPSLEVLSWGAIFFEKIGNAVSTFPCPGTP